MKQKQRSLRGRHNSAKKSRKATLRRNKKHSKPVRAKPRRTVRRGGSNAPGVTPHYPAGYSQYQNNLPQDTSYSLGGKVSSSLSAMANPPPIGKITNNAIDNLNHYAKNSYGKGDTGMGFPSRGWW